MSYYLYIVQCADDETFYRGITTDLDNAIELSLFGQGSALSLQHTNREFVGTRDSLVHC